MQTTELGIKLESTSESNSNEDNEKIFVDNWLQLRNLLEQAKTLESHYRKSIIAYKFPRPKKGTNKITLPDGRILKYTHKETNSIDESMLDAVREEFSKLNDKANDNIDAYLKVKYEPVMKTIESLDKESEEYLCIKKLVTTKPATGTLEVV